MTMIEGFEPIKAEPRAIYKRLNEYTGGRMADISDASIAMIVLFLKMTPENRREFLEAIRCLVCDECGEFSCLHGYSDE